EYLIRIYAVREDLVKGSITLDEFRQFKDLLYHKYFSKNAIDYAPQTKKALEEIWKKFQESHGFDGEINQLLIDYVNSEICNKFEGLSKKNVLKSNKNLSGDQIKKQTNVSKIIRGVGLSIGH